MTAPITPMWPRAVPQGGKHGNGGKRADLGGVYYRSTWESNIARYLNWLKAHGEIHTWEYETREYAFTAIKRGVRFYKPDFIITERNGSETIYEVKGWMDPKSKTALARMKKYYPQVKIIVIDQEHYQSIAKTMRHIIPTWERGDAPKRNALATAHSGPQGAA